MPYPGTSSNEDSSSGHSGPRRAAKRKFRILAHILANNSLLELPPDIKSRYFALHPCMGDSVKGSDRQAEGQGQATAITSLSPVSGIMTASTLKIVARSDLRDDHLERARADGLCAFLVSSYRGPWRRSRREDGEMQNFGEDKIRVRWDWTMFLAANRNEKRKNHVSDVCYDRSCINWQASVVFGLPGCLTLANRCNIHHSTHDAACLRSVPRVLP
jgi:hypothetical protein